MDSVKAKEWEDKFRGTKIGAWTIVSLIDNGKSAAVFRAEGNGHQAAVKIFDDEIIQRYGDEVQFKRIERELSLVGRSHPHMVSILDGGVDPSSGNHYIAMEYLPGPSLQRCLKEVPENNIPGLVEQLVSACEFLEAQGLAHRDIKPANIVLLDDHSRLVLLDFGVLRPIGEAGLTDVDDHHFFVGTLQYASPEFLLRQEKDDMEGWRALSLYQVGGVVHDLIMRRPLFEEFVEPYAALVNAVQHEAPTVASAGLPAYLVDACRMALVKDPARRLELVNWDGFKRPSPGFSADDVRSRLNKRAILRQAEAESRPQDAAIAPEELLATVIDGIKVEIRRIRQASAAVVPPLTVSPRSRGSNVLNVRCRRAPAFGLTRDLDVEVAVEVVDAATQAISVEISAAAGSAIDENKRVVGFKGPYASSAVGEKLEAALMICIDAMQSGTEGPIDLTGIGVE